MKLLKWVYEKSTGKSAPYYFNYSALTIVVKPIRKVVAQVLAPNCPFNNLRVLLYRLCGFKIGRNTRNLDGILVSFLMRLRITAT
jgi:hypothetical protein